MMEERFMAPGYLPEDVVEQSLRPHTLREYIGQTAVKDSLSDISKKMEKGLTEEEKAEFLSVLGKMMNNLNED